MSRTSCFSIVLLAAAGLACTPVVAPGGSGSRAGTTGSGTGAGGTGAGNSTGFGGTGPGYAGSCTNLQCQQDNCTRGNCVPGACANGAVTTASGIVYDPAGRTPLYNVVVYVPNEPLSDIASGASCDTCASPVSGHPIAATLTDSHGHFSLEHVPIGSAIPLVVQVGKWRRQVTIPTVAACTDTPVAADLTRLPRTAAEGHIPKIAIATGGSDALECLLRKIGVDTAEFTTETGPGRVNLYTGYRAATTLQSGTALTPTATLWGSAAAMKAYDLMLMSCEGSDNDGAGAVSLAVRQNLKDYADAGGRVFGSHWHNTWVFDGPVPWPTVATRSSGAHGFDTDITATIDTSFPKGVSFSDWMVNVGGSTTAGQILIHGAEHSVDAAKAPMAQQWIYGTDTTNSKPMVQYFSFNTPVEVAADQQCGRVVMSDLHVSAGTPSDSGKVPFPTGCVTTALTPQELALEFMIFDLSSCVNPDDKPPPVPPIGYIGRN